VDLTFVMVDATKEAQAILTVEDRDEELNRLEQEQGPRIEFVGREIDVIVRGLRASIATETALLKKILKQLPVAKGVAPQAPFSGADAEVKGGAIVGWSADL
jgi:hypothetical protein